MFGKFRVVFKLDEDQKARIDRLILLTDNDFPRLMQKALATYEVLVEAIANGEKIQIVDKNGKVYNFRVPT